MENIQTITYVDDFCFECGEMCKQKDEEHKNHLRLSNLNGYNICIDALRKFSNLNNWHVWTNDKGEPCNYEWNGMESPIKLAKEALKYNDKSE